MTILHIDSSARRSGSITRRLTAEIAERLGDPVIYRDLAESLPQISDTWLGANQTAADERNALQQDTLALSDTLIDELKAADTILIGAPMYNFAAPASLKAWIDLVARAGITFRYTEAGPEGLLTGKRAIVVAATGGTSVGSDFDFLSGYLRHILGFMGITDVEFVTADQLMMRADTAVTEAEDQIARLVA